MACEMLLLPLLTLLPCEHLGGQRRRQVVVVYVVGINGRNCAGQRIFFQDVVHLPLDALGPGEQVSLEALSGLHHLLLPAADGRQLLQIVVELGQDRVGGSHTSSWTGVGPLALCAAASWRGLARHVTLKLLRGEIERLSVQLLDEGSCTALKNKNLLINLKKKKTN